MGAPPSADFTPCTLTLTNTTRPGKKRLSATSPNSSTSNFYFPRAYCQIDWSRGYTFLEQELHAITQDAELGQRYVDKLVRVTRRNGQEDWLYLHLEVQGSAQAEFAKRMFVYNYRIFDRYD